MNYEKIFPMGGMRLPVFSPKIAEFEKTGGFAMPFLITSDNTDNIPEERTNAFYKIDEYRLYRELNDVRDGLNVLVDKSMEIHTHNTASRIQKLNAIQKCENLLREKKSLIIPDYEDNQKLGTGKISHEIDSAYKKAYEKSNRNIITKIFYNLHRKIK